MTSLPGTPEDHLDALVRFLLPAAQREIDRQGGFRPFGASMAGDGELRMLEAGEGSDEEQLEALRADAASRQAELIAVGICADVTLPDPDHPEAIRIELEHRTGQPATHVVPYRNTDEELTFATPIRLEGSRRTWP